MKRYAAAFLSALLLVFIWPDSTGAATARRNDPKQAQQPPLGVPDLAPPEEYYERAKNCSKEELEILDDLDEKFMQMSTPEPVMDREAQKFLMTLLEERENMHAAMKLYSKCGRVPQTHPLETDERVWKEDMRRIEESNRRSNRR